MKQPLFCSLLYAVLLVLPGTILAEEVVIYTALDQVFSEPILKEFEQKTGINVKAVYDVEAAKTTGLVNRLLAEKTHPQCDVLWNNEVMRTIMLKRKGVLTPYTSPSGADIPNRFKDADGYWAGFAARARVLVVNTKQLAPEQYPTSLTDLSNPIWRGQAAMANPLFGTTATHVASLFAMWGEKKAETFLTSVGANQTKIVDGNAMVRDMVAAGEIPWGITDTDDVHVGILEGKPIKAILPDQQGEGTLLIPNSIALIANAPHPEAGKKLIDFILQKETEAKLCASESAQIPLRPGIPVPVGQFRIEDIAASAVDFERVTDVMEPSVKFVQQQMQK